MGGIFLNYRTGDGDWAAALVQRELSSRFGAESVFHDSQSIQPGEDFSQQILARLHRCEVLLAMIGPRWNTVGDQQGGRRLDDPDDWVRREISEAFRLGLRIIPVLLGGIDRIDGATLPEDIAPLARCQYLRMDHRSDDFDLTRLVDELVELAPGLVTTWAGARSVRDQVARRGQAQAEPALVSSPPPSSPSSWWTSSADGELRSTVSQLRQALSDSSGAVAVQDLVQVSAGQVLDLLEAHGPSIPRYVDDDGIPAVLEERLGSYEHDMAPLLRMVAIGVCSGDRQHDGLWISVVKRFLDRRDGPARSPAQEFWVAAEAYPALLLTYVVGVAGMIADRDDLVYRLLDRTTTRTVGGRQVPVMRALALRHVVDPQYAAALLKWDRKPPYQALSVHLRHVLRSAFFNTASESAYESSFDDYECLRSLLELHVGAFSSLGVFAVRASNGDNAVYRRMAARLVTDSALLRSGAFDGNVDHVAAAWSALAQSTHGRYP